MTSRPITDRAQPAEPFAARLLRRLGLTTRERIAFAIAEAVLVALMMLPLLWIAGYLLPPINHDAAANLDVAHRWLGGDRLYVDIIDVNLPLVFILFAIPELLARLVGGSAPIWLMLCLAAAIAGSFGLSRRVLHLAAFARSPLSGTLLPLMVVFLLAVYPNDMFAQREHIMLIAAMPYLLLTGVRAEGTGVPRGLALTCGVLAGIGFGLKPHFLLLPFLIELYVLARLGPARAFRDPVPWTMGAMFFAQFAFIALVTPAYFSFVLPLVFEDYAKLGEGQVWPVLSGPLLGPTGIAVLLLLPAAIFLSRARLATVLAIFAIGAIAMAALQAKGWSYHSLPALAATHLLAAVIIAEMIDRFLPAERIQHRVPVAVFSAAFMLLFYYEAALFEPPFFKQREFEESIAGRMIEVIEEYAPNDRVLILSPGIYPHYPVINYTGARNVMRFQSVWLLQGIYADCPEFAPLYNPPEAMSAAEQFMFRSVAEDFAKHKPDLLIVDHVAGIPRCQGSEFQLLDYFQRNPLFARAFDKYQPLMEFDRYAVYQRQGR